MHLPLAQDNPYAKTAYLGCIFWCPLQPKIKFPPLSPNTVHIFSFFLATSRSILVSCPRIKPTPPAVEAWSLNHWTTSQVSSFFFNPGSSLRLCINYHVALVYFNLSLLPFLFFVFLLRYILKQQARLFTCI